MPSRRLTILVAAMIAAVPRQGGWTWAVLQYLLGLRRLGHEVFFVEPLDDPTDEQAKYFDDVVSQFGFKESSQLLRRGENLKLQSRADVLLNISGMKLEPAMLESVPVRVYVDLDPLFTQAWQSQGIDMRFAGHTHFATVGLAIGKPGCDVPTVGQQWITMPPPVVLPEWIAERGVISGEWTTVANWRGYGTVEINGVFHGQKVHSFRQFIGLPKWSEEKFKVALAIHPDETKDIALLNKNGWEIIDPMKVADSPDAYRKFVSESKAEIGIAKAGYVTSQCGWFSDRSVCYLAAGRPVLAQETGFSRFIPAGEGLLSFKTIDDAAVGVETICDDYGNHSKTARRIAEEYFDSDKVLAKLLREIGVGE